MPATLDRLRFFADTPDLSAFQFPDAPPDIGESVEEKLPTSRVKVAKVGRFKHPSYGTFTISPATFDSMIANFDAGVPTDQLPVDFDHEPDVGGRSEACGWIKRLEHDGKFLHAHVEWLWRGAFAIREGTYRYVSPTWSLTYVDEAGDKRGPTLLAFGLTNRPYFTLPAVSLSATFSRDEGGVFEEVEDVEPDPSDSPAGMSDFATFAKALGLKDDADEAAIVAAIEAKDTDTFAGHATLEDAAKADGKVVFTSTEAAELKAKAGETDKLTERLGDVETELADKRFEAAFSAALNDPKGATVAPAEKESLREVFDLSEAVFTKQLEQRAPLVNATPTGGRGNEDEAPENADTESFDVDREAKTYMAENAGTSYRDAVFAVSAKREQGS